MEEPLSHGPTIYRVVGLSAKAGVYPGWESCHKCRPVEGADRVRPYGKKRRLPPKEGQHLLMGVAQNSEPA